ncbi:hypothetical protein PG989_006435 [Apiospora arundinis]
MGSDKPHTVISFIGGREYQVPAKYSPDSASSNLDQFTCFSKLPPEIRTMIWQLGVPERITHLTELAKAIDYDSDKAQRKVPRTFFEYCPCTTKDALHYLTLPPVAQTCREAREAYQRLSVGSTWCDPFWNVMRNHERTWFNPSKDVLCLDRWGHEFDELNIQALSQYRTWMHLDLFAQKVGAVAFSLGRQKNYFYGPVHRETVLTKMDKNLWPRLETIMVYDDTIFLHPREGVTLPSNTLSVENPMALVDVRDTERIRHFKEVYESCSLPSHLDRRRVELLSSLLTKDGPGCYTDDLYQEAINLWASDLRFDPETPQPTDYKMYLGDPKSWNRFRFTPHDRRHPWVRDMVMPRMPPLQMVVAFKLCQASKHRVHQPSGAI